jgi:hypothetical protein
VKLFKIIPVLIMVGGIAAVANFGGDVATQLLSRVKVLVTGLENMNIAEEVRFYYLSYGKLPGQDDRAEFSRFLQSSFTPYYGSRQPSEDLFGNDYLFDDAHGPDDWFPALFSLGPNGVEDRCALLNGTRQVTTEAGEAASSGAGDDICVSLDHALRDTDYNRKSR